MNNETKVDIVEAYALARMNIPVGTVIHLNINNSPEPGIGLIIGHIFKNIRKDPKKHQFINTCLPIIFFKRNKYVCSLEYTNNGSVIAYSTDFDKFVIEKWKNNDFIVEDGTILPRTGAPYFLYD